MKVRDCSLITVGGLQNGRGGTSTFTPMKRGGQKKVLAMLKRGHKTFLSSFYAEA